MAAQAVASPATTLLSLLSGHAPKFTAFRACWQEIFGLLLAKVGAKVRGMDEQRAKELGLWCPFWGAIGPGPEHHDCAVIIRDASSSALPSSYLPPLPYVCMCDCHTCKQAWWAAGRPSNKDFSKP